MIKKTAAVILALALALSMLALFAGAYDKELASDVSEVYDRALAQAQRSSFYGSCNLATAYQLKVLGIYDGGLDYAGSGGEWYDHFKNVNKTSGGWNIVTVSGKNCLYDLVDRFGSEIYNVVYSLGTGGTSGTNHAMLIRAIIDGYVYFADSFGCTYSGEYYAEGECTVLPLARFVAAYKSMNGDAHGCIYFTSEKAEHLTGSSGDSDGESYTKRETGEYMTTASMLHLRSLAGTYGESLCLIPYETFVTVTQVKDNWGKIEYDGMTGWICLDYAVEVPSEETQTQTASVEASMSGGFTGDKIIWSADAQGPYYSFTVLKDGKSVFVGAYSQSDTLTYELEEEGEYKVIVNIADKEDNITSVSSETVYCYGSSDGLIPGDVNLDGVVSSSDARSVLRHSASISVLSGKSVPLADVNSDSKVTSSDARTILRRAAGLEK